MNKCSTILCRIFHYLHFYAAPIAVTRLDSQEFATQRYASHSAAHVQRRLIFRCRCLFIAKTTSRGFAFGGAGPGSCSSVYGSQRHCDHMTNFCNGPEMTHGAHRPQTVSSSATKGRPVRGGRQVDFPSPPFCSLPLPLEAGPLKSS